MLGALSNNFRTIHKKDSVALSLKEQNMQVFFLNKQSEIFVFVLLIQRIKESSVTF